MKTSPKRSLRASIELLLLPALERMGFIRVPLSGEDERSREIVAGFPYGRFKRTRCERFELLEIQFKKGGAAAFRFNLAIVPNEGVVGPQGRIGQDDAWVHDCNEYFIVYQRRSFARWFHVPRWPWSSPLTAEQSDRLVGKALVLLPEMEATLSTGKPGPHMQHFRI